jgi:organic radical activating enzyme
MAVAGYVQEAFVSFQGEGTHVGRRHVFLRTAGCSLRCRYCDTPRALVRTAEAEVALPGGGTERVANPVSPGTAASWVVRLDPDRRSWVAFTGGEPLEQAGFLARVAPLLEGRPLFLETAGVHAGELGLLIGHLRTISLDLKLHSVAGEGDRTAQHRAFLRASRGVERIAKIVLNEQADLAELEAMAVLLAEEDPAIPLVLQPETPRDGSAPVLSLAFLERAHAAAQRHLAEVRVIPQAHRFLRLP